MSFRIGRFTSYSPVLTPDHKFYGHPQVLFLKDEADQDWYDIVEGLPTSNNTYILINDDAVVVGLDTDPSMMFPANLSLYRVPGSVPESYVGRTFNPETDEFTLPPEPQKYILFKRDMFLRMTDEEVDAFEVVMASQPKRKQRIFENAQYLDTRDELFAELQVGFRNAFGVPRANVILQPTE